MSRDGKFQIQKILKKKSKNCFHTHTIDGGSDIKKKKNNNDAKMLLN